MFYITSKKGFHIKFDNGYTVSIQFGPGNYCDNYDMRIGHDEEKAGADGSTTAECAVLSPHKDGNRGNLIELPGCNGDTVTNRSNAKEVLELMNWASKLK